MFSLPRAMSLLNAIIISAVFQRNILAFSGSEYVLDTEYSGANFFDGWDFFTGRDPTGGFVTYYSRSSSHLANLINATDTTPAYMGVDYVNTLPITSSGYADGAGRPSVRISSKRSWTHGLFIGDFNHAPSGICGTWPAFWTLGPNWPYTGEVDIMESVNKVVTNAMSLHTNETCFISGNSSTQTGTLGNTNCAYYPDYNVGCGVVDSRPTSYSQFNAIRGGVYAMQWTSEYIRVWFFPRGSIPKDITEKKPDPSSWGLPAANLMGNCTIDQHFQQHKIIFDTTFCGEYAGNPYVWNSTVNSCAVDTGYSTCDAYVAKRPDVFRDAYWSINYVRVYQLVNPDSPVREPQFIASLQPAGTVSQTTMSSSARNSEPTTSLCPTYNFTTIQNGGLTYEIECSYDPPGPDIPPPYPNFRMRTLEDCVAGCTYWNKVNGTNLCGGVAYDSSVPFCYFKKYIDQPPRYRKGFAGARLIYYGYPQITDDPRSQPVTSTSAFIEILPTPQFYRPLTTVSTFSSTTRGPSTTSISLETQVPPPLGTATNRTSSPTVGPGVPTVSFSGTESIPVTESSTVQQNMTATLTTTSVTRLTSFTTIGNTDSMTISPSNVQNSTTSVMLSTTSSSAIDVNTSGSTTSSFTLTFSEVPIASSANTSVDSQPSSTGPNSSFNTSRSVEISTMTSSSASSTTANDLAGPTVIARFKYAGCRGSSYSRNVFILADRSASMTIERCVNKCGRSYYAALFDSECYCVNTPLSDNELITYPDSDCAIPCPGDVSERCGGIVPLNQTIPVQKRQASNTTHLILLTLYINLELTTTITPPSTTTQTITVLPISSLTSPPATNSLIYNVTSTNTVTVTEIATTWCDYCPTCPGFQATLTTTITVPCPVVLPGSERPYSIPTVPMTTVIRECSCGRKGALSSMTVTIPHEAKIAALTNVASQVVAETSQNITTCELTGMIQSLSDADPLVQANATIVPGAGSSTTVSVWPTTVTNSSNITLPVLSQILVKPFTGGSCAKFRLRTDLMLYLSIGTMGLLVL